MTARFVTSAATAATLPDHGLPEVAAVGRSNVGKSSLLSWLMGRPGLVRTSRTPGRTQLINLFVMEDAYALVDLPGYGYAKLSQTQRRALASMLNGYLERRAALAGLLLLVDARRTEGSDADREMAAWALGRKLPLLVVMTKADLVPKPRRLHHQRQIETALGLPAGCGLMCSSKSGDGRIILRRRLAELR